MANNLGEMEARWILASFEDPSRVTWSLPEQIASKLVIGIIRGEYQPGQRLLETALAQSFAVSRGPIREALRIVENEGLVVIQARKGASVLQLSRKKVQDIFEVRSALLGLATAEIAHHPSAEALAFFDAVTEALQRESAGEELDRFVALVYRGSMYIAEMAGNRLARNILFSLGRQTLSLTRKALAAPENRRVWQSDWRAVVEGIRRRDPLAAERSMRKLVDTVCAASLAVLEEQGGEDQQSERLSAHA